MENEQTGEIARSVVVLGLPLAPQTSLRDGSHWGRVPGLESPGYLQASLRDEHGQISAQKNKQLRYCSAEEGF